MIKFAKIGVIAIFSQLPLLTIANDAESKIPQGVAYVHTVRNSPTFKKGESSGKLKRGDIISPRNFEINCTVNQKAFIVFSNRTVLEITPDSDINIEEYNLTKNEFFTLSNEEEKSRSITKINLKKGKLLSYGLKPRPTSSFKITTPLGAFDIKSSRFIVSFEDDTLSISILNGRAIFKEKNGKDYFIKDQQRGQMTLNKERNNVVVKIDYITNIENESIKEKLRPCKMAFETIEFIFDKNGKPSVNRVVPKEFLNRLAK